MCDLFDVLTYDVYIWRGFFSNVTHTVLGSNAHNA